MTHEATHFSPDSGKECIQVGTVIDHALYMFNYTPIIGSTFFFAKQSNLHAALGHPTPEVMAIMGFSPGRKNLRKMSWLRILLCLVKIVSIRTATDVMW